MNYYIVVEGRCGESIVYPKWIKILNPSLNQVSVINEIDDNNYYLISGNGYPSYLKIIERATYDMANFPKIDELVIAIDAEDWTIKKRNDSIIEVLTGKIDLSKCKIIIQTPCLEAWALGNSVIFKRHPTDTNLKKYIRKYDVRQNDPENIPDYPEEKLNRSQFSFKYLKKVINERYSGLTYTKNNPMVIAHEKYFSHMRERLERTCHLQTFKTFIDIFEQS